MASLDKMEGATVQAVGLVLLAVVVYLIYYAFKLTGKIPTLAEIVAQLKAMLSNALGAFHLPAIGTPDGGTLQAATLYTGTAQGLGGPDYAVTQNETLDYQIPLETVNG